MKKLSLIILTIFLTGCSINSSYVDTGKLFNGKYSDKETSKVEIKEQEKLQSKASFASGVYNEPFRLELSANYPSADIFYSVDDDVFNIEDFNKYETPILIDRDTEIRFYANFKDMKENVHQESYKIEKIIEKIDPFEQEKNTIENFIRKMNINTSFSGAESDSGYGEASTSEDGAQDNFTE